MKLSNRKKPLTNDLKAECDQLKRIFQAKKKSLHLSQASLAQALGCNQSSISHYLNGVNPLNANAAAIFAKELKVNVSDFSPRLAKEMEGLVSALSHTDSSTTTAQKPNTSSNFDTIVTVPFLKDIQLAAGSGKLAAYEDYDNAEKIPFNKQLLSKQGIYARNIVVVTVSGDSMSPLIPDGSTVAIDIATTTINNGDIYAIAVEHELLKIKQLYKLPNGNIQLHSFNTAEFTDEEYNPMDIRIIGRVFWYAVLL